MPPFAFGNEKVKRPSVSGQFYSADAKELARDVDGFIKKAPIEPKRNPIDILIAPHAGYVYSGPVAGYSFKAVAKNDYKTIIILAPSHFVEFDGISVWEEGAFETPLGTVEVDQELTKKLISANKNFYFYPEAFAKEHSLEVELPFLQRTFKNFKIVPVVMGQPSFETLESFAVALEKIIANRQDILIVVSTDMSHYHPDKLARQMDFESLEAIKELKAEKIFEECGARTKMEMCGFVPVTAALLYAKAKGLNQVEVLRYANSGDVSGDTKRVVGYSSVIIYKDQDKNSAQIQEKKVEDFLTLSQKRRLIDIAKETIKEYVTTGKILEVKESDPALREVKGAFVTIHKKGNLRGCIGNIIGQGPLYLTVRDMAISAATEDPRFSPLTKGELKDIEIEISVLSKPRLVKSIDEITLGVHGVILSQGAFHQGVFLPQVATETGWSKEEFLVQLCSQKARLPKDAWKDSKTKIETFTAEVFSESDVKE